MVDSTDWHGEFPPDAVLRILMCTTRMLMNQTKLTTAKYVIGPVFQTGKKIGVVPFPLGPLPMF